MAKYRYSDSAGDELRIGSDESDVFVTVQQGHHKTSVDIPHGEVPALARAALAAAGNTGHEVVSEEKLARLLRAADDRDRYRHRWATDVLSMRDRAAEIAADGEWSRLETPADRIRALPLLDDADDTTDAAPAAAIHAATPEGSTPCGEGHRDVTVDALISDITCVECLRAIAVDKGAQVAELRTERDYARKLLAATIPKPNHADTPAGRAVIDWGNQAVIEGALREAGAHRTRTWTTEPTGSWPATPADLPHIIRQMDEWTREVAAVTDLRRSPLADRVAQLERDMGRLEQEAPLIGARLDALELAARETHQSGGAPRAQVTGGGFTPQPCPTCGLQPADQETGPDGRCRHTRATRVGKHLVSGGDDQ